MQYEKNFSFFLYRPVLLICFSLFYFHFRSFVFFSSLNDAFFYCLLSFLLSFPRPVTRHPFYSFSPVKFSSITFSSTVCFFIATPTSPLYFLLLQLEVFLFPGYSHFYSYSVTYDVFSTVTGLWVVRSEVRFLAEERNFTPISRLALGPNLSPVLKLTEVLLSEIRRPWREADQSSTSSAALLNLGCTDPLGSMVMFQGAWNLDGKKITTLFSLYTN